MNDYVKPTGLLDFGSRKIQELVDGRKWKSESEEEKIRKIYNYVRDEIKFGFNVNDTLPASRILKDGYGQCNTKSILFMALLRAVGVSCRVHGFTVNSDLQKGALTGLWYRLRPKELVHTWVEVLFKEKWLNIEGFILDVGYLESVQDMNKDCVGAFCGFGIAISDVKNPPIFWTGADTYIQKDGIIRDFGVFDDPDAFFRDHRQNLNAFKRFIHRRFVRHVMNRNIEKIRKRQGK